MVVDARPALRSDLRIFAADDALGSAFLLEDRLRAQFFRIGYREYQLVRRLDGKRSFMQAHLDANDALRHYQRASSDESAQLLEVAESQAVIDWLAQQNLIASAPSVAPESSSNAGQQAHDTSSESRSFDRLSSAQALLGKLAAKRNPLFFRLPLINPNRLLNKLFPWLGWLVSPRLVPPLVVLVCSALFALAGQSDRIAEQAQTFLTLKAWIWVLPVLILAKCAHELAHGLACKRYAGEVPEAGIMLVLFFPIGYVDTTSAWRFASRWQRVHVALAGIYLEFWIATLFCCAWLLSQDPLWSHLCFSVMLVCGLGTLVFNANPLLRFDGYYALSDMLGVPNLYSRGQAWVGHRIRALVLGSAAPEPSTSVWGRSLQTQRIVKIYGICAAIWRLFILVAIGAAASQLLFGLGAIFVVYAGSLIFGVWITGFALSALRDFRAGRAQPRHALARVCTIALLLGAVLMFLRLEYRVTAYGEIEYQALQSARPEAEAFISHIFVEEGQRVERGQELAQLRNPELELEIARLEAEIAKSEIRQSAATAQGDTPSAIREQEFVSSLRAELQSRRQQNEQLLLKADLSGVVLGTDLMRLRDQWVQAGAPIMEVAANELQLKLYIDSEQVGAWRPATEQRIEFAVQGRSSQSYFATISHVSPKASSSLDKPGLAAPNNGPLAIRVQPVAADQPKSNYSLLTPHIEVVAQLSTSASLRAGEIAKIELVVGDRTIAEMLQDKVEQVFDWISATQLPQAGATS